MKSMMNVVNRFVKEEDAPTMVEYGLLVALIALVVIVGAAALGTAIQNLFSDAAVQIEP